MAYGLPTSLKSYQAQRAGTAYGIYNPKPPIDWAYINTLPGGNNYQPPQDQQPQVDYSADFGVEDVPAPAPFRPQLANDPAWLAYLNSLGLQRNQFESDIARRRGLATADLARQFAALQQQGKYQRENVTGRLESSGFGRSGILEQALARQRASQANSAAGLYAGVANQLGSLETELASKIADLEQNRAAQELTLRTQGYQ